MSEDLIGRADNLMRRSRSFVAGQTVPGTTDDGIPLLTDEVDLEALIAPPEPEDRTEEITAEVTERVTREVTEKVTAEVTERVTAEVTESVTAAVTRQLTEQLSSDIRKQVTEEIGPQVREDVRADLRRTTSNALNHQFADLAGLIQSLIDDWSTTTLPALVSIEMRAALEAVMSEAVEKAAARIREQAILDLRDSIADEIETRSAAVVRAALSGNPSEAPDQPL